MIKEYPGKLFVTLPRKESLLLSPITHRKTIKHLRNSRLFIIFLLITLQVLLIFALGGLMAKMQCLLHLFSIGLSLWLLSRRDNASYKISWLLLILLLPLSGGLFYLIFGNKRMGWNMKKQLSTFISGAIPEYNRIDFSNLSPEQQRLARYLLKEADAPLHGNTQTEYFSSGESLFQRLTEELSKAHHFIFLEFFIIGDGILWDSILKILEEKSKNGVEIRILADDVGCIRTLPADFETTMAKKGIDFVFFNPLQPRMNTILNYRDHRKIAIIDGSIAFTGGANLSDEYVNLRECHGHWKDSGLLLHGSGAENMTRLFLQLWQFSTGQILDFSCYGCKATVKSSGFVQPFGSDPVTNRRTIKNAYLQLCEQSLDFLYITTPYLILDDETLSTLQTASLSGVDVRIITPHIADKWYVHSVTRSYYTPLLEAGVRIFEYTPGFIHGKMLISDDKQALIGSANLDFRSFYLQFECAAALYHDPTIPKMTADFLATQKISQEITLKTMENTPVVVRFLRTLLRLIAGLL